VLENRGKESAVLRILCLTIIFTEVQSDSSDSRIPSILQGLRLGKELGGRDSGEKMRRIESADYYNTATPVI